MRLMHVIEGKPEQFTPEEEEGSEFDASDNLFWGCIISVLAENLVDSYIRLTTSKDMWDALEGVSDAGSELYILEEFLDYRMLKTFFW